MFIFAESLYKMKQIGRKIGIIATLILLILAAVLLISRWKIWFYNPPEPPYHGLSEPGRVLLTFGTEDEWSRNISWQCGEEVKDAWVETSAGKRILAQGTVFASRSGKAAYYVAKLRRLKPNTSYRYRVVTDGKASRWYQLRTQPLKHKETEFMYVGDVQDTIGGQANRFLLEAWQRHPQTEFLICGGDLVERPIDDCWAEAFRSIDSISQTLPVLCVTGNHDYLKGLVGTLERRFSLVFSYFLDSEVSGNQVYTLRYGDVQFFLLDSNRELPNLAIQRGWLQAQLQRSQAKWKIVVLHHPLHSIKGYNNLTQCWMFDDLVREYGVDLVLQGHEHAYARMTRKQDDGTPTTPVYTVSHCSPKNYRIEFDDKFDKFGISSRYYQQVRIKGDTLSVAAYEVEHHQLYDSLAIVKPSASAPPHILDYGKQIPEYMEFTPESGSKKDEAFAQRIREYCQRHPERLQKQ